jgi:hypothetical protein
MHVGTHQLSRDNIFPAVLATADRVYLTQLGWRRFFVASAVRLWKQITVGATVQAYQAPRTYNDRDTCLALVGPR